MGKILVFQHVPYEILGTFDPMIRDRGFRVRYVNFGRDADERSERHQIRWPYCSWRPYERGSGR